MDVVTHDARCTRLGLDGVPQRAHWEAAAKKGNAEAQAKLDGPPYPNSLRYLDEWFEELSAARGEGMSGPAPITHRDIEAWASLTGHRPLPHEVQGLLALDTAWRLALRDDEAGSASEVAIAPAVAAWPMPKEGAD